jgi:hypothetical protein
MDAYVYGVTRASASSRSSGAGVDDQPVELVAHRGLAALVSDAPTVPVKANRLNLMAHARVLHDVVAERCVLPMQFGVVMPDRGAVRDELLDAAGDGLRAQLDSLEPYVELDVRAVCSEDALLRAVVAEHPEIGELRARLEGTSPEAGYYERIRLGELVARAVEARRDAIGGRIAHALEPLAAAVEPGDILHEGMLANAAFLVRRDSLPEVDAALEAVGSELGAAIRLHCMGPLAPHNFVDMGAVLGAGAWA